MEASARLAADSSLRAHLQATAQKQNEEIHDLEEFLHHGAIACPKRYLFERALCHSYGDKFDAEGRSLFHHER